MKNEESCVCVSDWVDGRVVCVGPVWFLGLELLGVPACDGGTEVRPFLIALSHSLAVVNPPQPASRAGGMKPLPCPVVVPCSKPGLLVWSLMPHPLALPFHPPVWPVCPVAPFCRLRVGV
jgi:hypothetical protein